MELICAGLGVALASGKQLIMPFSGVVAPLGNIGIEGESGSGKTLLCRAIANCLPPGLRRLGPPAIIGIRRAGTRLEGLPLEEIVMIPQSPASALPPAIRCGDLLGRVTTWSGLFNMSSVSRAVHERFEEVGLDPGTTALKQASELSGGMAQRFAIALALARRSRLVILDEPTVGLDSEAKRGVIGLLSQLSSCTTRFVIVSHDKAVLAALADRRMVVECGRVRVV